MIEEEFDFLSALIVDTISSIDYFVPGHKPLGPESGGKWAHPLALVCGHIYSDPETRQDFFLFFIEFKVLIVMIPDLEHELFHRPTPTVIQGGSSILSFPFLSNMRPVLLFQILY